MNRDLWSKLLISVRSPEEARAATLGGADLIDIKEPANGPLGQASLEIIGAVIAEVAGRRPISVACGELKDNDRTTELFNVDFLKWGLAGLGSSTNWRDLLATHLGSIAGPAQGVVAAYADWKRAKAPPVVEVADFVAGRGGFLLVDTYLKDGTTLLDWLSQQELMYICASKAYSVALAGSLGIGEIDRLRRLVQPEWIAVRGAACDGGNRTAGIDSKRVQEIKRRLAQPSAAAATCGS